MPRPVNRQSKVGKPDSANPVNKLLFRMLSMLSEEEISSSAFDYISEKYSKIKKEKSVARAWSVCTAHFMMIFFSLVFTKIQFSLTLLWNYTKIAIRNLKRNKVYSFINISGLAVGMACALMIMLWALYEFSFDGFHENSDRIFRIKSEYFGVGNRLHTSTFAPYPLLEKLKTDYPEIIDYTRIRDGAWLRVETDKLTARDVRPAYVTPNFLEFFNFPVLIGDPKTVLRDKNTVVITEETAHRFFGNINPVGERMYLSSRKEFYVTGVVKDIPENSHIMFDILMNENVDQDRKINPNEWKVRTVGNYLLVNHNFDQEIFEERMFSLVKQRNTDQYKTMSLQPLKDIHLKSGFDIDAPNYNRGNLRELLLYCAFAFTVLLIACINFMSLSTANSARRFKEVGLRKVCGASKRDIIKQFYGESMVFSLIALAIAAGLVFYFRPLFEEVSGRTLHLELINKAQLVLFICSVPVLTGLISASYPALYLSSFQPISVLKNMFTADGKSGFNFRSVLVTVQYVFAIILLIGSIVIYAQMDYIKNKDLGFKKENMISIYPRIEASKREAFKMELLKDPNVNKVTYGFIPVRDDYGHPARNVSWQGKTPGQEVDIDYFPADYDYLETFGIELVQGRFFSREYPGDKNNYVVNEAAVKMMGFEDSLGKRFSMTSDDGKRIVEGEIIGVVKDFHISSMRVKLIPFVFTLSENYFAIIRLNPSNQSAALTHVEKVWKTFIPDRSFDYSFIDRNIYNMYYKERRVSTILKTSTILAISIFCLGLFALISFITEQRTKEIGIRKVLGADIREIVSLIFKEFIRLLFIAFLISSPISYYLMRKWLMNFAYRVDLSLWMFVLAGSISLVISFLTVFYRTVKAATANPIDSLRYE